MELLNERPITGHEDDGMRASYGCSVCDFETVTLGEYDPPIHITCPNCGDEGGDES